MRKAINEKPPSIIEQLKTLVKANPSATVRELAEELGVTIGTISNHLREIEKSKKLDK